MARNWLHFQYPMYFYSGSGPWSINYFCHYEKLFLDELNCFLWLVHLDLQTFLSCQTPTSFGKEQILTKSSILVIPWIIDTPIWILVEFCLHSVASIPWQKFTSICASLISPPPLNSAPLDYLMFSFSLSWSLFACFPPLPRVLIQGHFMCR